MTAAQCQSSRAKGQGNEHGNTNLEMLTKKSFTNVTQTASSDLSLKERFADVSVKLGEVDMAKHRLKTKLLPEFTTRSVLSAKIIRKCCLVSLANAYSPSPIQATTRNL